jgi:putative transposase
MKNTNIYAGYRYPPQIISHAVWRYHRFALSLCDIEELLAARSITVSYETVRNWCAALPLAGCQRGW